MQVHCRTHGNFCQFRLWMPLVKKIFHKVFHVYVHTHYPMPVPRTLYISRILIGLPTTSLRVVRMVGEIKFSEVFVTIQSMIEPLAKFLASKFLSFAVCVVMSRCVLMIDWGQHIHFIQVHACDTCILYYSTFVK